MEKKSDINMGPQMFPLRDTEPLMGDKKKFFFLQETSKTLVKMHQNNDL